MAKKSIILVNTDLVWFYPNCDGFMIDPEARGMVTYCVRDDVQKWCEDNLGYFNFNTRKARIKFENEDDATLFTLTWL